MNGKMARALRKPDAPPPAPKQTPTQRRQAILNWINANGEVTLKQIATALEMAPKTTQTYLREMRDDREVVMGTRVVTSGTGRRSRSTAIGVYKALATVTAEHGTKPKDKPKGKVHLGTHRAHPIKNSGGQGAVPLAFGIQSTLG